MKYFQSLFTAAIVSGAMMYHVNAQAANSTIETSGDVGLVLVPALAWGMSQWKDDSEGQQQFYWSMGSTLLTTELLKYTIHERRPDGNSNDSFPSAHTSLTFSAATYIQQRYGWKSALPFYAAASYVGWTRVQSDRHYTKDVVAGALIGYLNARYFTEPYHGVQVSAYAEGGSIGLNLHMAF
ncbi:phosphatase PAP2 family protein [Shewanella dokdonensis]|nr:phosphatase PAP2 family protein [Shewanella dokdonensis]MCL1074411.1 phosphatase PAP2 family protein [Shewanella dokdonensis]